MHKLQGHTVQILASTETYIDNRQLGYVNPCVYINEDNIKVTRVAYKSLIPLFLAKKLRLYSGLKPIILDFNPDIIFLHDVQFLSIQDIVEYKRINKRVVVYADSHTDSINSATSWISKNVLHKIIYKWCAKRIEPFLKKFYGTLPSRLVFLRDMYSIGDAKLEFLPLGADDSTYDLSRRDEIRTTIRTKLGLDSSTFILVTGGKIDERKNIHMLVESMQEIGDNVKLIIFGTPNDNMNYLLNEFDKFDNIIYLGWQNQSDIYELLIAADLGVFPGTHSVLWEQACGVGLPCIFKKWDNIQHVNLNGNCKFLEKDSVKEISSVILEIVKDKYLYMAMKNNSAKCVEYFAYSNIAKRAIEN